MLSEETNIRHDVIGCQKLFVHPAPDINWCKMVQDYDEAGVPMFTFGFHLYIWNPNDIPSVGGVCFSCRELQKIGIIRGSSSTAELTLW